MKIQQNNITLSDRDYTTLCEMLRIRGNELGESASRLASELKRARIVKPDQLDSDIVRVNSRVTITDIENRKSMSLKIVYPTDSDISQYKISVLAPLGTALLGYRKGDQVEWDVPAGKRLFSIDEVFNE